MDAAEHLTMLEKHDLSLEVADEFCSHYRRNGLFQKAFWNRRHLHEPGLPLFWFSLFSFSKGNRHQFRKG
jgi:hypothetical protein